MSLRFSSLLFFILYNSLNILVAQNSTTPLPASEESLFHRISTENSIPEENPPARRSVALILENDIQSAITDAGLYITSPLRFAWKDWVISASVVGGSVALFSVDESLRRTMQQSQTPLASSFAEVGRIYGETLVGGGIGAAIYGVGLATNDDNVRVTGRLVLEALAFGGSLNLIFKSGFGRSRPFLNQGAMAFAPFQFTNERTAFPSGHATVAFAVSSVLSERIGNPAIGAGLYALAALTGLSRMYHDVHWASDVLLGAAIGTGAGLAVTYFERERKQDNSSSQTLYLYPTLNGIALTYHLK